MKAADPQKVGTAISWVGGTKADIRLALAEAGADVSIPAGGSQILFQDPHYLQSFKTTAVFNDAR